MPKFCVPIIKIYDTAEGNKVEKIYCKNCRNVVLTMYVSYWEETEVLKTMAIDNRVSAKLSLRNTRCKKK